MRGKETSGALVWAVTVVHDHCQGGMAVEEQLGGKISRTGGKGACTIGFWSEQQGDGGSVLQGGLTAKGQTDGTFALSQRREEGGLPALSEEMEGNHCYSDA